MRAIFFRKRAKKGKIFGNLGKNVQNMKIGQLHAGDYCRHDTARICPGGGSDFKVNKSRYKQCGVIP